MLGSEPWGSCSDSLQGSRLRHSGFAVHWDCIDSSVAWRGLQHGAVAVGANRGLGFLGLDHPWISTCCLLPPRLRIASLCYCYTIIEQGLLLVLTKAKGLGIGRLSRPVVLNQQFAFTSCRGASAAAAPVRLQDPRCAAGIAAARLGVAACKRREVSNSRAGGLHLNVVFVSMAFAMSNYCVTFRGVTACAGEAASEGNSEWHALQVAAAWVESLHARDARLLYTIVITLMNFCAPYCYPP